MPTLKKPSSVCSRDFFEALSQHRDFVCRRKNAFRDEFVAEHSVDDGRLTRVEFAANDDEKQVFQTFARIRASNLISSKSVQFSRKNFKISSTNRRSRSIISSPSALTRLNFFGVTCGADPFAPFESPNASRLCSSAFRHRARARADCSKASSPLAGSLVRLRIVTPFAPFAARSCSVDEFSLARAPRPSAASTKIGTLTDWRIASNTATSRTRSKSAPSLLAFSASSALSLSCARQLFQRALFWPRPSARRHP